MADNSYVVNRNGKNYKFTPGNNSSYIAVDRDPVQPLNLDAPPARAKVINSPFTGEDPMKTWSYLNKRKSKIVPTNAPGFPAANVSASRG